MKKIIRSAIYSFLLFLEVFFIKAVLLIAETFPLDNTEAVTYTLTHNISGAKDYSYALIYEILTSSIFITLLIIIAISVFWFTFNLINRHRQTPSQRRPSFKKIIVITDLICLTLLIHCIYRNIPLLDYYKHWNNSDQISSDIDFYTKEYIDPDSLKISFSEKRNLILILLESIEYNFQDSANGGTLPQNLIPEITNYIKTEQSFIPGGTQITGTGWTMADVVAKTCGIPLMLSPSQPDHPTPHGKFIPGASCLTDILHQHGYVTIVSKGADLKFSGMEAFVKTHLVDEGYGRNEYLQQGLIDQSILNEWGVPDSAHYALIKKHIERLSATNKPWAVWMITLNTHTPYGANDPACHIPENALNWERLHSNIHCSSQQLDDFIKWAKKQEWFEHTTIAVMGDHATMAPSHVIGFNGMKQTHYWLDFFINSAKTPIANKRTFTSLDMFPTILEAMGAKIPEKALGLGRSLYSWSPTLLEKYGLDSLNKSLNKHNRTYSKFLYFDKKAE